MLVSRNIFLHIPLGMSINWRRLPQHNEVRKLDLIRRYQSFRAGYPRSSKFVSAMSMYDIYIVLLTKESTIVLLMWDYGQWRPRTEWDSVSTIVTYPICYTACAVLYHFRKTTGDISCVYIRCEHHIWDLSQVSGLRWQTISNKWQDDLVMWFIQLIGWTWDGIVPVYMWNDALLPTTIRDTHVEIQSHDMLSVWVHNDVSPINCMY